MLKDLKKENISTHILYADSSLVEMYVYDALKNRCQATLESTLEVDTVSKFNSMLSLIGVNPFLADKWFVILDYKRLKNQIKKYKGIFHSMTSCFLVVVQNYKDFQEAQTVIKGSNNLYMAYLNYSDVLHLLGGRGMSQKMVDYVARHYSSAPDKVITLVKELENGLQVESERDIHRVCGENHTSILSFLFSMMLHNIKTSRGRKRAMADDVKGIVALANIHGSEKLKNYMVSNVKDVVYLKTMYLNGVLYDEIRGVPEPFEEKKLLRYKRFFKTIIDINLDSLVRLFVLLTKSGRWYNEWDAVNFVYEYYKSEVPV